MGLRRRIGALGTGLSAAALPLVAAAAEESRRALPAPEGSGTAMLATVGAIGVLFLVWSLGHLYARQRGLYWDFQRAAEPTDHH